MVHLFLIRQLPLFNCFGYKGLPKSLEYQLEDLTLSLHPFTEAYLEVDFF